MGPMTLRSLWLFALALAGVTAQPLALNDVHLSRGSGRLAPEMRYRFTSFATSAPKEAAAFCIKYFGAVELERSQFLTHKQIDSNATVVGLRFYYNSKQAFHDVYFVLDLSKPSAGMTPSQYLDRLHNTHHFDIEETWDWYQDWHLCFRIHDVDLVAYRLVQDKVPVVTRSSYSFYVEVPFGITFQFLGSKLDVIWSEVFNFCRYTDGTGALQPLQIAELPEELPPLPELKPGHHSFFSNAPWEAYNFTLKYTSATPYDMDEVFRDSHRYGDGRCAQLLWVNFGSDFQLHYVDQFRKYEGEMKTRDVEAYLTKLHGNMSRQDAFFDFRVGFEVDDLSAMRSTFLDDSVPFLDEATSMFFQIPGGIIVEVLEAADQGGANLLSV